MKIVYCGLESSGKSLILAQKVQELIWINKRYKKKYGFVREIWSNLLFSNKFYEKNKEFIRYWKNISEIVGLDGIDVIHDEISADFNALKREPLPRNINIWLRQGAKRGVNYYATAQEFHDIHLDFRRRVKHAYYIKKVIGSPRGGKNLPPVNFIWGLSFVKELVINPYNELIREFKSPLPSILWITRNDCEIFDTYSPIDRSEELPLIHRERKCHTCNKTFISHE